MKKNIIFLLILSSLVKISSQPVYSDTELIQAIENTVNNSLERLERFGKAGEEKISGIRKGTLIYTTELTGFNKVLNTLNYDNFQDYENVIMTGTQISDVSWGGTGIVNSEYSVSGPVEFTLYIFFNLKKRVPYDGFYILTREDSDPVRYPYNIIER